MRNERAMLDVIHECVINGGQAMPAMQEMVYKVPWRMEENCQTLMSGILASRTFVRWAAPQNEKRTHRFL